MYHSATLVAVRGFYRSLFCESDRSFYLAVFRILLGVAVLWKILLLLPGTKFLFARDGLLGDPTDLTVLGVIPISIVWEHPLIFYSGYACATILMLFGLGRRLTVAIVFLATVIHQDLNWFLMDGGDNLLRFSLLYLIMADSFAWLSVSKKPFPKERYSLSNFCTNIAVAAIIGHLCLVYMVSGFSKAHSEVWYNGTAMYYIMHSQRFQGTKWNEYFANSILFNVMAAYTTIIWESTFAFAVFVKGLRTFVLAMGVAMHLGIFVLMMIHGFQLIFIFHYGLFFTNDEWFRFLERARLHLRFGSAPTSGVEHTCTSGPGSPSAE